MRSLSSLINLGFIATFALANAKIDGGAIDEYCEANCNFFDFHLAPDYCDATEWAAYVDQCLVCALNRNSWKWFGGELLFALEDCGQNIDSITKSKLSEWPFTALTTSTSTPTSASIPTAAAASTSVAEAEKTTPAGESTQASSSVIKTVETSSTQQTITASTDPNTTPTAPTTVPDSGTAHTQRRQILVAGAFALAAACWM